MSQAKCRCEEYKIKIRMLEQQIDKHETEKRVMENKAIKKWEAARNILSSEVGAGSVGVFDHFMENYNRNDQ